MIQNYISECWPRWSKTSHADPADKKIVVAIKINASTCRPMKYIQVLLVILSRQFGWFPWNWVVLIQCWNTYIRPWYAHSLLGKSTQPPPAWTCPDKARGGGQTMHVHAWTWFIDTATGSRYTPWNCVHLEPHMGSGPLRAEVCAYNVTFMWSI